MDKERLEKEALKYANSNMWFPEEVSDDNIAEMAEGLSDAFKDGAKWRIGSVWHGAEEKPGRKLALVEYPLPGGGFGYLVIPNPDWLGDSITGWAYIEDLLPQEKGGNQ